MTQKRLDMADLPRDPQHFQGRLRTELVKMANYVRKYPKKAEFLKTTLTATLEHIQRNLATLEAVEDEKVPSPTTPESENETVSEKLTRLRDTIENIDNIADLTALAGKVSLTLTGENLGELKVQVTDKYNELIEKYNTEA